MAEDGKKYVVYGMKAKCSEGSMENYISTDVGHGVIYQGQPLLNANDHTPQVNLTHFGDCHSRKIYEEAKKQADEKYKTDTDDGFFEKAGKLVAKTVTKTAISVKENCGFHKCELDTPLPWIFVNKEHMIDGAPALTVESQCACRYGGIITIVQEQDETIELTENEIIMESAMAGPPKIEVKVLTRDKSKDEAESYIGRYPMKYIEGILMSYETHKIIDGRFVLDNGGKTIAYGHDVREGEDFSEGLSMQEGLDLAVKDLDEKYELIKNKVEELNEDYGYNIDIDSFTENEMMFLIDFVYNRGYGLVERKAEVGPLKRSLTILIVAVTEGDDERIREVLMEETYNLDGVKYDGLIKRRMDEYEILKFGDYERDEDIDRDYTKPKHER